MTVQPERPISPGPPDKTPKAIRAALLPEDQGRFDRAWRSALARAAEELDLAPVQRCIEEWWRLSWLQTDRPAYYRALDVIDRLNRGEDVPTRDVTPSRTEEGR